MSWLRSHARLGSGVALLALALQLVLSFGHIHRNDILGRGAPTSAADTLTVALIPDADPATPPDRAGNDHEDEYCAIYAIAGLISSAQLAEPPALPVPAALTGVPLPAAVRSLPAERRYRLSQARAPPIV
jgi:hypothetical protein